MQFKLMETIKYAAASRPTIVFKRNFHIPFPSTSTLFTWRAACHEIGIARHQQQQQPPVQIRAIIAGIELINLSAIYSPFTFWQVKKGIPLIRANLTERIWKYTSDNEVLRKENWTEKIITELMVSVEVGG